MTSNHFITYKVPDGTEFKFTMIFQGWAGMNGIVITSEIDITHPDFLGVLNNAREDYPYFEAIQATTEGIYNPNIVETIFEGVEKGVFAFSEFWSERAEQILNGEWEQPRPITIEQKSQKRAGYVYLVRGETNPITYKIGFTKDIKNRIKTFSVKLPFPIEFVCAIKTDDMIVLETELHKRFADKRLDGEWFDLSSEDVEYIRGLA